MRKGTFSFASLLGMVFFASLVWGQPLIPGIGQDCPKNIVVRLNGLNFNCSLKLVDGACPVKGELDWMSCVAVDAPGQQEAKSHSRWCEKGAIKESHLYWSSNGMVECLLKFPCSREPFDEICVDFSTCKPLTPHPSDTSCRKQ